MAGKQECLPREFVTDLQHVTQTLEHPLIMDPRVYCCYFWGRSSTNALWTARLKSNGGEEGGGGVSLFPALVLLDPVAHTDRPRLTTNTWKPVRRSS